MGFYAQKFAPKIIRLHLYLLSSTHRLANRHAIVRQADVSAGPKAPDEGRLSLPTHLVKPTLKQSLNYATIFNFDS